MAASYFQKVELNYKNLVEVVASVRNKPKVLSGLPWNDVWHVPGGKSFAAEYIRDAGGNYIWDDNNATEAIPLSLEAVLLKASNADIWINAGNAKNMQDILAVDERIKSFSPYKHNKIYNNMLRVTELGGNDYWESGIVDAHIILCDLIMIFHPEMLTDKFYYYKKLN